MTAMGPALGLAVCQLDRRRLLSGVVHAGLGQAEARSESAVLLPIKAHAQLQDYAERAEELSAVRERNRMARELHDSVNQSIFSILTAEAARNELIAIPRACRPISSSCRT
jgi:signal transduction histidine kinase